VIRSWNQRVDVGFEIQHLILVKASFARKKSIQQVNSELQHKEYLTLVSTGCTYCMRVI
jgi:hypothetical protein